MHLACLMSSSLLRGELLVTFNKAGCQVFSWGLPLPPGERVWALAKSTERALCLLGDGLKQEALGRTAGRRKAGERRVWHIVSAQ